MKSQEVIVYANAYSFTNDEGQLVEGGKINILGKRESVINDYGVKAGHRIGEFKVSKEEVEKIVSKVPALCDIEYDVTINRDNAVVLVPKVITVVKEFKSLI